MLRIVLIFIWLISSSIILKQTSRGIFGVRVSIGASSQINTYVCYLDNGRTLAKKRVLDRVSFIKIVSGYWPSIYNPDRINYFEENNIPCGTIKDSLTKIETSVCVPFDSLWKIRFSTYPFQHNFEMGWSNKLHKPSLKQEKYLFDNYDVGYVDSDFFLDTNFWKLIQDVQNYDWIKNYKALK